MARRTCARTLEGRSSSSLPGRNPPVSTRWNRIPSISTGRETRSRVTPGIPKVIARRFPAMRLNSVDFPTFGRPTSDTVNSDLGIPQSPQHRFVSAPVLFDLHEQLQVYPLPRLFLQFLPRLRADPFQHPSAPPDEDPLLRIPFDENLRANAD